MATFEERLTAIEHEYTHLRRNDEELEHGNEELRQKVELHTMAIGALVNKATLERLNEKHDKIFDALIAHDQFTNQQLAEIREKLEVQVEGKIAGLQTEVRQGFEAMNARFERMATKDDLNAVNARFEQQDNKITGLQIEMRQGFEAMNARFERMATKDDLNAMNARFERMATKDDLNAMNARFEQQEAAMNARFEQQGKQMEAQGTQIETLNKQMETLGTQMGQVLLLLNTLANKPA